MKCSVVLIVYDETWSFDSLPCVICDGDDDAVVGVVVARLLKKLALTSNDGCTCH